MRVFLDTNVVIDYCCHRQQFDIVDRIFLSAEESRRNRYYISIGSFYTIAYLMGADFKGQGIREPERTDLVRRSMEDLLGILHVAGATKRQLLAGLRDAQFTDLEDSFQYQTAAAQGCRVLVTINDKDFRHATDALVEVLTPVEFVNKYL